MNKISKKHRVISYFVLYYMRTKVRKYLESK